MGASVSFTRKTALFTIIKNEGEIDKNENEAQRSYMGRIELEDWKCYYFRLVMRQYRYTNLVLVTFFGLDFDVAGDKF